MSIDSLLKELRCMASPPRCETCRFFVKWERSGRNGMNRIKDVIWWLILAALLAMSMDQTVWQMKQSESILKLRQDLLKLENRQFQWQMKAATRTAEYQAGSKL